MWLWTVNILFVVGFVVIPLYYLPPWIVCYVLAVYYMWIPRESKAFRRSAIWKHILPNEIKIKGKLQPEQTQVIYAVHPHGLFGSGIIMGFALNENALHIKPVGTSILFWVPIVKDFAGLAGAIPAGKDDINSALDRSLSLVLAPGGIREVPGLDESRKINGVIQRGGFLSIARDKNVPVVPVWAQGVEELYSTWVPLPTFQGKLLSHFYYPGIILSWGRSLLGFLPQKHPITIFIGEPLYNPTQQQFYDALQALKTSSDQE
jgi:1-acyl-sn-glycerol-3-phosphate acyltransferase